MNARKLLITATVLSLTVGLTDGLTTARAQEAASPKAPNTDTDKPNAKPAAKQVVARGITWFGTWELGLAEAKRTGRPILFTSAAPACGTVPGMW